MLKIGVLVSGGGTNLQAIIDGINNGKIKNGKIVTVVSSRDGVYALERAENAGIPHAVIKRGENFDVDIINHMKLNDVDLIVLAGFLSILGKSVVQEFNNRIINVHPSLIPAFCGPGYYGIKVHEKVLEYGVKITGASVHIVNEIPDGGPIILQKPVEVLEGDTTKILQQRVMEQAEWVILPEAIHLFCQDAITVSGRHVSIKR